MRIAFFTDNYCDDTSTLDPFRLELLKAMLSKASALFYVQANDFINWKDEFTSPHAADLLKRSLQAFKPDLIFSLNRAGLFEELLDGVSCPVRSWYIDNPSRFPAKLRRFRPGERVFCATRYMMGWLARNGGPGIELEYLPFCTNTAVFSPGRLPQGAAPCDVSFVGTLWKPAQLIEYIDCHLTTEEDRHWFAERLDRRMRDYDYPLESEVVARFGGIEVNRLRNAVDDLLSTRKRLDVLEALADLDMEIYGTRSWAGQCLLRSHQLFSRFSPRVVNSPESLRALYRRSRVCLSISHHQAQTGFPIRIFDILATGAPLVTDRRPEIGELFEEGRMFLAYDSPEEARDCVLRVLRDPAQAARMRDAAVVLVRGRHTFQSRIESLLGGISQRRAAGRCGFLNGSLAFNPAALRGGVEESLVVAALPRPARPSLRIAAVSRVAPPERPDRACAQPRPPERPGRANAQPRPPGRLGRACAQARRIAMKSLLTTVLTVNVLWLAVRFLLLLVLGRLTGVNRRKGLRTLFHLANSVGAAQLSCLRQVQKELQLHVSDSDDRRSRAA
jgi:glycosyltransferase involved in cell wall biosynthesis